MHELSLAENIIQLVEQTAGQEKATRVKTVFVEVGRLAQVDVDALCFAFEVVARGGCAAGAHLAILDVEALGVCEDCGVQTAMVAMHTPCAGCGGHRLRLLSGQEMRVKGVEIETTPVPASPA